MYRICFAADVSSASMLACVAAKLRQNYNNQLSPPYQHAQQNQRPESTSILFVFGFLLSISGLPGNDPHSKTLYGALPTSGGERILF